MRARLAVVGLSVLLLASCGHADQQTAKPKYGTWGFDTADMDRSVPSGNDFFDYVLGSWVKTAQIPVDRTYTGVDLVINDQTNEDLKAILEQSGAQHAPAGSIVQQTGDLYAAFMDEAAAEKRGVEPVRADLTTIDRVSDKAGLSPTLAALNTSGAGNPFPVSVDVDPNTPTRHVAVLWQGGLSMDRDYYLKPEYGDVRDKFVAHAARLLGLAGYADARVQADQIMALETKLAQAHWPLEEERDVQKTRTVMPRNAVENLAPGAPLKAMFDMESIPPGVDFQVGMPDVVTKTAALFADEPLETWKAYLRYHLLAHYSGWLSKPFDDETFDFYGRELSGQQQQSPRWRRGVHLVNGSLGDALGQLYVISHFPATTRQLARDLVEELRRAYSARIDQATWMAQETKWEAQAKLTAMLPKIGYPEIWKTYEGVQISPTDLIGDIKSTDAWYWRDQLGDLAKPIDRAEWSTTPQTNNAFYNRSLNDITFTAAILQAPYFDPAADPAANYGAIGATIGHEMSHGFDDQGRQADSRGALRDWWTAADAQRYNAQAAKLIAQFNAYEPQPGLRINGTQTQGENIADLAGLRIAYDAYKRSLGGKEAPVIDGFTGDQRFFIAYAASWKSIDRPEAERDLLLSDQHSPAKYRVNGIVRNMDEWYTAFDVKEGDALYLRPEDRVRIW